MRLKGTPLCRCREHEYLLARRQVCSRCRSKGYDRGVFRYCHHLTAAPIGELELSTVVGCDNSVDVRVRHRTVGTKIVRKVPLVCTACSFWKDQQGSSSHLSVTARNCRCPYIGPRFYVSETDRFESRHSDI